MTVNDKVELKGMLDSESVACTMSEVAEGSLRVAGALVGKSFSMCFSSNVLKCLMHVMKSNDDYRKFVSTGCKHLFSDYEHFLDIMSCAT